MQIRLASDDDIVEMHRIRLAVRENRLSEPGSIRHSDYGRMLAGDGRGWIAEIAGRMVGFAVADLTRANIWALFVDPEFEGRGVGRALHDEMVRWLFQAGVDSIWLSTDPGTRAERFYDAAGWLRAGFRGSEIRFELSSRRWFASGARQAGRTGGASDARDFT